MRKIALIFACLAAMVLILLFGGCNRSKKSIIRNSAVSADFDSLLGTWKIDNHTTYYFDGTGKGSLILPDDTYDFTYKISNKLVELDFEDPRATDSKYEFSVENDKLFLIGKNANDGTYELKKAE